MIRDDNKNYSTHTTLRFCKAQDKRLERPQDSLFFGIIILVLYTEV